jgi:catalase
MQMEIKTSRVNYSPNSLGENLPAPVEASDGGFVHHPAKVEGQKIRERSPSFAEHFSQATLFWNSLSTGEQDRVVEAAHFELGKVPQVEVKQRMLERFNKVDGELAKRVAKGLGMPAPTESATPNHGQKSAALTQENTTKTAKGRMVAILAADGVDSSQISTMKEALSSMGIYSEVVSLFGGTIVDTNGDKIKVDKTFLTTASVLYDAIYVPGGDRSVLALTAHGDPLSFIHEAFKHFKPMAATGNGVDLLMQADLKGIDSSQLNGKINTQLGVVVNRNPSDMNSFAETFMDAIKEHRFWTRPVPGTASVKAAAERMLMEQVAAS